MNAIIVYIFYNLFCMTLSEAQVVKTTSGVVMGRTIDVLDQNIEEYLGIPYAVPPIRKLRFAKPKPIETPIEGIIDARKPKNSCLQSYLPNVSIFSGIAEKSEDCLVLNIWTQQQNNSHKHLKPVMFWLYGGALFFGSIFQEAYNGSVLATHDVVFVAVNYRLGHFGFLYGGDESAPGNVGFYDQNLALKWVSENIHLFGGDKNKITIFGQSAGSWSVAAHILSPVSKGLFKRAIMMSGVYMFNKERPVISKEEALKNAKKLAKSFGCEDDEMWLRCLRAQDPDDQRWYSYDIVYPVVDTEFLPLKARTALEQGQFNKDVDLLAGFTKNDGTLLVFLVAKEFILVPYYHPLVFNYFLDKLKNIFHNIELDRISKYYLNNTDMHNSTAIKMKIFELMSDFSMKCPTYLFTKLFEQHSPKETNVFFYELTHKAYDIIPGFNIPFLSQLNLDPLARFNSELGVGHTADIPLVFGHPFLYPNTATPEDTEFSKEYMKLFTDFAKNGKPDPKWPEMVGTEALPGVDAIRNLHPGQRNQFFTSGTYQKRWLTSCNTVWKNYF